MAKSCAGPGGGALPRDQSFGAHAILDDEIFVIPDAQRDARFHDHPMVAGEPGLRFHAGCPIAVSDGSRVGTLCLLDVRPRNFDADDQALLRDLTRMVEQELAAVRLATMDELTLLSSRRGSMALAQHALAVCARERLPASLLYFDLDGFKSVNDRHGHAEGDRALQAFAPLLRQCVRDSDVPARLGGDESVVLLTHSTLAESAAVIDRLQAAFDAHNVAQARSYSLGFSVGEIAHDPGCHAGIGELMAASDTLMYERKRRKRAA